MGVARNEIRLHYEEVEVQRFAKSGRFEQHENVCWLVRDGRCG